MNNKFKVLSVNFKRQHKDLYNWIRKYSNEQGCSCSDLVRRLIKEFKDKVEETDNE